MGTLTKSAITAARNCPHRGRLQLIDGEHRPSPAQPTVAVYRARDSFITACNRIFGRHSAVAERAVASMWAEAWNKAGGMGPPTSYDLAFAAAYARNPHGLGQHGREVLAIQPTLRFRYMARAYSCRPDALVRETAGSISALEFTSAKQPVSDALAVSTMAALDQTALDRSLDLPRNYRAAGHRVLVCDMDFRELDITLGADEVDQVLRDIDSLLEQLAAGQYQASPSQEQCPTCPRFDACEFAWRLDEPEEPSASHAA